MGSLHERHGKGADQHNQQPDSEDSGLLYRVKCEEDDSRLVKDEERIARFPDILEPLVHGIQG
jgi:hypothetical protein